MVALRPLLAICLILTLSACQQDETVTGYAPGEWQVAMLEGEAVSVPITLTLSTRGEVSGQAPCNRYSANQTAPYPWLEIGPIAVTRMACPELALESRYLAALARMTLAEVAGPVLIFSNDAGEVIEYAQNRD